MEDIGTGSFSGMNVTILTDVTQDKWFSTHSNNSGYIKNPLWMLTKHKYHFFLLWEGVSFSSRHILWNLVGLVEFALW